MLSPDELNHAPDALTELWNECETDILKDMARRISTYDYFIPAAQHQKQKLEAAGLMENEIRSRLSKLTGRTESELTELFTSAGEKTIQTDTEIYKSADIYRADKIDKDALNDVLRSGLVQTQGLFKNLTQTTANTATRQFENALDRAWMQVSSGAFDYNTAVRFAVKDLSKTGIQTIQYGSGAVTSVEAAVRRAVVTGLNQTALKLQDALADEVGCDLVETTAHGGARPEHAVWQGRVFSRSGRSEKYPKFSSATGYGTGEGLGGWNCRHSYYPYVEGAARAYTDAQLKDYEARKYEYNGRQMTEYEASQQQRKIERNVRRWKRENVAMKAAGMDTTESAVKIAKWQGVQKDFLNQTGLKRQAARENIAGWGHSQASQATAANRAAQKAANKYFSLGSQEENMEAYLKEKPVIDLLISNGVEYKTRISSKEIIVSAGHPTIIGETIHAKENRETKTDRDGMTIEQAQKYVDAAKMTVYWPENETLKFMSQNGYAVLNFEHTLITAVPQKWRKKYDKYL